jgi:hypothetical protein
MHTQSPTIPLFVEYSSTTFSNLKFRSCPCLPAWAGVDTSPSWLVSEKGEHAGQQMEHISTCEQAVSIAASETGVRLYIGHRTSRT